jgi:DNA-directed RNA polymerase specialized sigma24 family protein
MPSKTPRRGRWEPDQAAFSKLLALLHPDPECAGEAYELLRLKLEEYFVARRCLRAERLADDTLDRMMRRLDAGEVIEHAGKYAYGVARLVYLESLRTDGREVLTGDEFPEHAVWSGDDYAAELKRKCLIHCLESLSESDRRLFLIYTCQSDQPNKQARRQLAEELGISATALRIRAFRLRERLEVCVRECLEQKGTVRGK